LQKNLIITVTIAVILIIAGGAALWAFTLPNQNADVQPTPTPEITPTPEATPTPAPEPLTEEQIRDEAIVYMQTNHAELAELLTDISWEGGRVETGLLGSEIYNYTNANWTITVQYPVVPNPIYTITANYTAEDITLTWEGTYENGTIIETSYNPPNFIYFTKEQIRDSVMNFIQINHDETAPLMTNLNWTAQNLTPQGLIGYVTYRYDSTNWVVTVGSPVTLNPIYKVNASYTDGDTMVTWEGTAQGPTVTETSYNSTGLVVLTIQEQVRDAVMNYIKTNHNETAVHMQDLSWTGGIVDQGMLVGSSKYNYESFGWNMTMQYPVVLDPIYTITVNYYSLLSQVSPAQNIIAWSGTWQNGTITEDNYSFTP